MENINPVASISIGAISFIDYLLPALQFIFIILSIILISLQIYKYIKK